MRMRTSLIAVAIALYAIPVWGQVLPGAVFLTPTSAIEVTASADHSRLATDGTPWVSTYKVYYYLLDSSGNIPTNATAAITTDIGKPTPDANNLFRVSNIYGAVLPDVYYRVRIAAVGPGGEGVSTPTDPFAKATPPSTPAVPGARIIR